MSSHTHDVCTQSEHCCWSCHRVWPNAKLLLHVVQLHAELVSTFHTQLHAGTSIGNNRGSLLLTEAPWKGHDPLTLLGPCTACRAMVGSVPFEFELANLLVPNICALERWQLMLCATRRASPWQETGWWERGLVCQQKMSTTVHSIPQQNTSGRIWQITRKAELCPPKGEAHRWQTG